MVGILRHLVDVSRLEYMPIVLTILATGLQAARINTNVGFFILVRDYYLIVVRSFGVYMLGDAARSRAYIDCEDYVQQLPQTEIEALLDSDDSSSKQLISYTREKPTRHDGFVSTAPNQKLYYKEDNDNPFNLLDDSASYNDLLKVDGFEEIKTLDG